MSDETRINRKVRSISNVPTRLACRTPPAFYGCVPRSLAAPIIRALSALPNPAAAALSDLLVRLRMLPLRSLLLGHVCGHDPDSSFGGWRHLGRADAARAGALVRPLALAAHVCALPQWLASASARPASLSPPLLLASPRRLLASSRSPRPSPRAGGSAATQAEASSKRQVSSKTKRNAAAAARRRKAAARRGRRSSSTPRRGRSAGVSSAAARRRSPGARGRESA